MRTLFVATSVVLVTSWFLACPDEAGAYHHYHRRGFYGSGFGGPVGPVAFAQANLANAQAAGMWQQAYSQRLQNQLAYTKMFFERRQMHDSYMRAMARPPLSLADIKRLNVSRDPKPLPADALHGNGDIAWPQAFQAARFSDQRTVVEVFFAAKHQQGRLLDPDISRLARQSLSTMKAELQSEIRDLPIAEYLDARNFLDGLSFEGFRQHTS